MKISDYFLKLSMGSFALAGVAVGWYKYLLASYPTDGLSEMLIGATRENLGQSGTQTVTIFVCFGVVALVLGLVARRKEVRLQLPE